MINKESIGIYSILWYTLSSYSLFLSYFNFLLIMEKYITIICNISHNIKDNGVKMSKNLEKPKITL